MNKELTIKERAALLMGLMSNSSSTQMPTKEAREALKILNSLQTNTSKTKGPAKIIKNPVTNTKVVMSQNPNAGGGNDVSFTTRTGYQRPGKPNSPTQLQGIQATLNQMLSEIPIKGTTGDSRYTASPIYDDKDILDGIHHIQPDHFSLIKKVHQGKIHNKRNGQYGDKTAQCC